MWPEPCDLNGRVVPLADPLRQRRAFWHLVLSGPPALPLAKAGLSYRDPAVRFQCARIIDHLADPEAFTDLAEVLSDPDAGVRAAATPPEGHPVGACLRTARRDRPSER
jgi:hypothetical protein